LFYTRSRPHRASRWPTRVRAMRPGVQRCARPGAHLLVCPCGTPWPEGVCNPFRNVHAHVAAHSVFRATTKIFKSENYRSFRKQQKTAGRINARRFFLTSQKKSSPGRKGFVTPFETFMPMLQYIQLCEVFKNTRNQIC